MIGRSIWIKFVAVSLSGLLLSGCVSRKMEFTSAPKGAEVVVGSKRGVTPCTLKVPKGATHACFSLPSGASKELPLPDFDTFYDEVGEKGRIVVGGTMMGVGYTVAAVGGVTVILTGGYFYFFKGGAWWGDESDEMDQDIGTVFFGGLGILGLGAGTFAIGHWIYPDYQYPILHADFGLDKEELYEDRGYGARRMKTAE